MDRAPAGRLGHRTGAGRGQRAADRRQPGADSRADRYAQRDRHARRHPVHRRRQRSRAARRPAAGPVGGRRQVRWREGPVGGQFHPPGRADG
ncbi:hypothetical protein G6F50_017819 [Rhizopus delemar]|uniref:Uncharacterized protein n=1 Tax=Rhizopus delemar TaxID=936053 RepID=A0A9P6XPM0_9FUNG|nr:hypothetical protein G6F50_017819 [Rhizopus delemar]